MLQELQAKSGQSLTAAVGLAHLLGEGSIVQLLTKDGFEVERVKTSDEIPTKDSKRQTNPGKVADPGKPSSSQLSSSTTTYTTPRNTVNTKATSKPNKPGTNKPTKGAGARIVFNPILQVIVIIVYNAY